MGARQGRGCKLFWRRIVLLKSGLIWRGRGRGGSSGFWGWLGELRRG
jgi:hypothetical protein